MGFLLWTGAILWGLLLTLASFGAKGGESLLMFFIGWAPAGLLVWFLIYRAGKREAAHTAMLQEAGVAQGSGFDHAEADTGIAINKQAKTLSLVIGGFYKTYPYTDIREWQAIKETPGVVVGGTLAAAGAAAAMAGQAAANTGFFVTVRDVDNPKWRIAMKDVAMQARWMELMRQEINER
jgi:hypothetical protein